MDQNSFNKKAIGAIRYIGLKSIQQAQGGHIGMAISAAPITYTLFTKFIKINPYDGKWINRDRFILSGGHGSMSLYPIFYLAGIFSKNDMKNFKSENSKTPGHPEYEDNKKNFIDASTGPLGQGFAMAVGMALAQKHLENITAKDFPNLFNNFTYVVCGDGDLQEGISYEAMAIAGKYSLNKLIVLHDSNKFQIDNAVSDVSIENLKMRAESNNWFYIKCSNDPKDIEKAIIKSKQSKKPSFIEVETIIAEGLNDANTNKGHHGNLSNEDISNFQKYFDLNFKDWNIDEDIKKYFQKNIVDRGIKEYKAWEKLYLKYKKNKKFFEIEKALNNEIDYKKLFDLIKIENNNQATRVYLKQYLSILENNSPLSIATCADLASSTNIVIGKKTFLNKGQYLPLGIREFAMSAIMNGFLLYDKSFKIIGGTFLVFSDYMKASIRLGCLMKLPAIYVFTHDSYYVGGDGPTHQPFDQLPMLRAIENLNVFRPADELELKYSLLISYNSTKDTNAIILTRQSVKSLNKKISFNDFKKGAYILKDCKDADYVIAASGSEVEIALSVANELENVRVVSVPCLDRAIKMSDKEIKKIFFAKKLLLTMEPSSDYKWLKLHLEGQKNYHLGGFSFGKSMDGKKLYSDKGFDKTKILEILKKF